MSRLEDELKAEVRDFLRRHNMHPSTFGRLALNDSAFCSHLFGAEDRRSKKKRPRSPSLRVADNVRTFMHLWDRRHADEASKPNGSA